MYLKEKGFVSLKIGLLIVIAMNLRALRKVLYTVVSASLFKYLWYNQSVLLNKISEGYKIIKQNDPELNIFIVHVIIQLHII